MPCIEYTLSLLMITVCVEMNPGVCSPVLTKSNRSDCGNECRRREFCDRIEKRCSPCSPKACELGFGQEECRSYCSDYHRGLSQTIGPNLETALDNLYNSRVRTLAFVQFSFVLAIFTMLLSVIVLLIWSRLLRKKHMDSDEPVKGQSIEMVKRNNLDLSIQRTFFSDYDKRNMCNHAPQRECMCVSDVLTPNSTCDTISDTEMESADLQQTLQLKREDIGRQMPESQTLIPGCHLQPSPLNQNL